MSKCATRLQHFLAVSSTVLSGNGAPNGLARTLWTVMSFTASFFPTAARRSHFACRVLRNDPGPSTILVRTASAGLAPSSRARHAAALTRPRSFYSSSTVAHPQPTLVVRHPRWINKRHPSEEDEDADEKRDDFEKDEGASKDEGESQSNNLRDENPSSSAQVSSGVGSSGPGEPSSSSGQQAASTGGSSSGSGTQISKQSVPESYPQVLALPIARRPLFPGFYKAVVIRNPNVVSAIKEMMKRGQPYLGAFLLKDENTDSDVITDINSVHQVGVFAQITSVFTAAGKDDKEEGLTAVLYPHRRIKITELIKPGVGVSTASVSQVDDGLDGLPTPPASPAPESGESVQVQQPCES